MDDPQAKFVFDELDRLASAEEGVLSTRNTTLAHVFMGGGVGTGFWAAISKDAFISADLRLIFQPSYLVATLVIFTFVFAGSLVCWLRLLNGSAKLSIIRAKRMVIRHELTQRNFCLKGYTAYDINRADFDGKITGHAQGFRLLTTLGFCTYICGLAVVGSICVYIVTHLVTQEPPQWPPEWPLSTAYFCSAMISAALLITLVAILVVWIRLIEQRSRAILGKLLDKKAKPALKRSRRNARR